MFDMDNVQILTLGRGIIIKDFDYYFTLSQITDLAIRIDYEIKLYRSETLWIPKSQILYIKLRKSLYTNENKPSIEIAEIILSKWFLQKSESYFEEIKNQEKKSELDEQYE